jgi:DNA-binding transcriptional ArsR family regulator
MPSDQLSLVFSALADPTRRAILARLASGECTVGELAKPFAMSGPAVSKHLRVLERAGFVARGRDAQWRPCRLQAAPIKKVADWVEEYREFFDASYKRLDAYLDRMMSEQHAHKPQQPKKRKKR